MAKTPKKAKKRQTQLNVSMTSQELKQIRDNAKRAGMSVSAFVRRVCVNAEVAFSVNQVGGE